MVSLGRLYGKTPAGMGTIARDALLEVPDAEDWDKEDQDMVEFITRKELYEFAKELFERQSVSIWNNADVNDLNDHLAELVDTLDDMDGSVVRSDVDEKDPVLMTKRHREKFVKSEQLRGDNFKSGLQAQKPFNPWEDIKKKEMQQRKMEMQGIKDDKAVKEELKKEKERKEWIAIQEAKQERAKRREARTAWRRGSGAMGEEEQAQLAALEDAGTVSRTASTDPSTVDRFPGMFWIKLALLLPQGLALREIMRDFAPTKEQVEKISKSKTRCVMPMANSGHGFVCEQDLEGSSMECTIKTQPYKWLFRMVSSVKVKVPRSWSTRTCRRLMLQVPRWLGSLSELPCIKKDSGRGYKRWCLLPQSADGRLVEVLNAEISEVDLDSMQYSAVED
eukprot:g31423.t1